MRAPGIARWKGMITPGRRSDGLFDQADLYTTALSLAGFDYENAPELKDRYEAIGMEISGGTAEAFGTFLKAERDRWAQVVKISGAKAE